MEKHRFNKFYRVFRNDTAVAEVSFNDFRQVVSGQAQEAGSAERVDGLVAFPHPVYALLPQGEMYYGYNQRTQAMEMAKAGALKHIARLIAEGPSSSGKVYQYRFDHYEDLNIHLKDSAIQRLKISK